MVRVAADEVEFAPTKGADEAFALAEEMRITTPADRRAALEEERVALVARLAEIDAELEKI